VDGRRALVWRFLFHRTVAAGVDRGPESFRGYKK
jgi:hypothetical protein